ncbi:MAG: hypothetical protein ACQEQU_08460 [Spirochaetota bacterium]
MGKEREPQWHHHTVDPFHLYQGDEDQEDPALDKHLSPEDFQRPYSSGSLPVI